MSIKAPQTWQDDNTEYPVSAARMAYMETRITEASEALAAFVASKPEVAAEGAVKVGQAGFARFIVANLTGNGVKKAFKIPHGLKTLAVDPVIQKSAEAALPGEVTLLKKINAINTEEIEVEFETAPISGATYWIKISG